MIGKLARIGGKFLASRAVTLVLLATLTAGGAYTIYVLKERGSLQERLAHERQAASAWRDEVGSIRALQSRFDAFDAELSEAHRERQALSRAVDRKIEVLRRDIPDVDAFLSHRAPGELIGVLCEEGTIDSAAPECTEYP